MRLYYMGILLLMIFFDINHPKYFTRQNERQYTLTRVIYSLLIFHTLWILSNFTLKKRVLTSEYYFEFTKMLKIPLIVFLFFISDEFERILIFFYFFVVY